MNKSWTSNFGQFGRSRLFYPTTSRNPLKSLVVEPV